MRKAFSTWIVIVVSLTTLLVPGGSAKAANWGNLHGLPAFYFFEVCRDGTRFQFVEQSTTALYSVLARQRNEVGTIIARRQAVSLIDVAPFPLPVYARTGLEASGFTTLFWNAPQAVGTPIEFVFYYNGYPQLYTPDAVIQECYLTDALLDRFDRDADDVGAAWVGKTEAYAISEQRLQVNGTGPLYWQKDIFGATQEAAIVLDTIDPDGKHGVLLKVQGVTPDYRQGAIRVVYDAQRKEVRVETYQPATHGSITLGWRKRFTVGSVELKSGDMLSAAIMEEEFNAGPHGITVIVCRTPRATQVTELLGIVDTKVEDFSFFKGKSGRVGLWFENAEDAEVALFARAVNPPAAFAH